VTANRHRILFEPTLAPGLWPISARPTDAPAALCGAEVEHLFCGTAAVYRAIRALGLQRGEAVLMPDYNCGIEVQAVQHAGAALAFYRVGRDGVIDLDHLERQAQAPGVRSVYVIHYFGFAQPIAAIVDLCRRLDLTLIEDCAHTLYSHIEGRPLGTHGQFGIFSPRKTLPLPDGGALVYGKGMSPCAEPLRAPQLRHAVRELMYSASQFGARSSARSLRAAGRVLQRGACWLVADDAPEKPLSQCGSEDFDSVHQRLDWRMSSISRRLLDSAPHTRIIERRRSNFRHLAQQLPQGGAVTALYGDLPDGICPLYFPVLVDDRDRLHQTLRAHRVDAFRYWGWKHPQVPGDGSTDADHLRRSLLALPLHQDLDEVDMARIVDACRAFVATR
jgi:dTDP-4-amino-4,6-dideoxygalactose transaminase